MIDIRRIDGSTYEVTVKSRATTKHRVTAEPSYVRKMTGGRADAEALIRESFEFLLERESNTSILGSFDLPVIGRYFPEYESEIRGRL